MTARVEGERVLQRARSRVDEESRRSEAEQRSQSSQDIRSALAKLNGRIEGTLLIQLGQLDKLIWGPFLLRTPTWVGTVVLDIDII